MILLNGRLNSMADNFQFLMWEIVDFAIKMKYAKTLECVSLPAIISSALNVSQEQSVRVNFAVVMQ